MLFTQAVFKGLSCLICHTVDCQISSIQHLIRVINNISFFWLKKLLHCDWLRAANLLWMLKLHSTWNYIIIQEHSQFSQSYNTSVRVIVWKLEHQGAQKCDHFELIQILSRMTIQSVTWWLFVADLVHIVTELQVKIYSKLYKSDGYLICASHFCLSIWSSPRNCPDPTG